MNLDDMTKIEKLDSKGMFQIEYNWPDFIEELLKKSIEIPEKVIIGKYVISYDGIISRILICGMGGSAISGDYLSSILKLNFRIPIIVNRNYEIPSFVDDKTLVIIISYSGNTEETLSSLILAIKKSSKIISITSGGILEDFSKKYNLPFFKVRPGFQPRASFPLLFFPLFIILDSLELYKLNFNDIKETIAILREMREEFRPESSISKNKAKKVANLIFNRIPVIWSPIYCVANRMKCQLNENAKIIALAEEIPESNHNHIVGWEMESYNSPFTVIAFRFNIEHPNISIRYEITKEIIQDKTQIIEIYARGTNTLSQLLSATYFGDYVSLYLAIQNNKDPSKVDSISYLKSQLEQRKHTYTALLERLEEFSKE